VYNVLPMTPTMGRSNIVGVMFHSRNDNIFIDDFIKQYIIYVRDMIHLILLNINPSFSPRLRVKIYEVPIKHLVRKSANLLVSWQIQLVSCEYTGHTQKNGAVSKYINLFLTLHGHCIDCQQRELFNFLMR
jgi:hypothetical protein